jgi:hypothetical protein
MDKIQLNDYVPRDKEIQFIKDVLTSWDQDTDAASKKSIYVYGHPGSGKTTLINNTLKALNYDIVKYDAGDIRNATIIDEITQNNMTNKNIMSLFNKSNKKIAIIMDEIDGMNNGDKGGINALIKLIRPKKTKKQKLEKMCVNPIICIGNYRFDKKIKELMKVCNSIEIPSPSNNQIRKILNDTMTTTPADVKEEIVSFIQGDLCKLDQLLKMYYANSELLTSSFINSVLQYKMYNNETKKITHNILNFPYKINEHLKVMNDTDRTSVGLLWHENIIDMIEPVEKAKSIPFYIKQLDNICVSDYIDRITFQNQIWQFNEMSSLIKTFKNAKMYHNCDFKTDNTTHEIRFTKVLTKYSTEYNNLIFIQRLCQTLGMDKCDLFAFFISIKEKMAEQDIVQCLDNCEITKLDINRIYKFIDKYINKYTSNSKKEIEMDETDMDMVDEADE